MNDLEHYNKFKKCEIDIPSKLIGVVLLRLIEALGYELKIAWFGGNGRPQHAEVKLVNKKEKSLLDSGFGDQFE